MNTISAFINSYWRYIVDLTVFAVCVLILGGYQMRLVRRSVEAPRARCRA